MKSKRLEKAKGDVCFDKVGTGIKLQRVCVCVCARKEKGNVFSGDISIGMYAALNNVMAYECMHANSTEKQTGKQTSVARFYTILFSSISCSCC